MVYLKLIVRLTHRYQRLPTLVVLRVLQLDHASLDILHILQGQIILLKILQNGVDVNIFLDLVSEVINFFHVFVGFQLFELAAHFCLLRLSVILQGYEELLLTLLVVKLRFGVLISQLGALLFPGLDSWVVVSFVARSFLSPLG